MLVTSMTSSALQSVILTGAFQRAIESKEFRRQLRQMRVRERCWWHCKKWERQRNGRRPIR